MLDSIKDRVMGRWGGLQNSFGVQFVILEYLRDRLVSKCVDHHLLNVHHITFLDLQLFATIYCHQFEPDLHRLHVSSGCDIDIGRFRVSVYLFNCIIIYKKKFLTCY